PLYQYRSGTDAAAFLDIAAHGDDLPEHVAQVAGDGHFLHRELDLAIFHPVTAGAARVVTGYQVQPLPHQLGDQQAAAHATDQCGLVLVAMSDEEIVHATGVGGARHTQLAARKI